MVTLFVQWILYALALLLVSSFVHGFNVTGFVPALVASLVIGLLNTTLGKILKIVTFPLSILTLGIFLLVINSLMILLTSAFVKGFTVHGFFPAFWGAVAMAVLGMVIKAATKRK